MRHYLPIIATILYALTAIDFARVKNWPMTLMWASYAAANCGIVWSQWGK